MARHTGPSPTKVRQEIAAIATSLLGCQTAQSDFTGLAKVSLIGGAMDMVNTASVAIESSAGTLICSGGLVSPRVVLTAAHCLVEGAPLPYVTFGANMEGPTIAVGNFAIHPEFTTVERLGGKFANDLALLTLESVAPVQSFELSSAAPVLGETLWVNAFGRTSVDSDESGVRYVGATTLSGIESDALELAPSSAQPCVFDSGGPVLRIDAQQRSQVGVVSSGSTECSGNTRMTQVIEGMSFIHDYKPETGQSSSPAATGCVVTRYERSGCAPICLVAAILASLIRRVQSTSKSGKERITSAPAGLRSAEYGQGWPS